MNILLSRLLSQRHNKHVQYRSNVMEGHIYNIAFHVKTMLHVHIQISTKVLLIPAKEIQVCPKSKQSIKTNEDLLS